MESEDIPSLVNQTNTNGYNSSDNESLFDDSDEEIESKEPTTCLFCEYILPSVDEAIEHLCKEHEVNLGNLKKKFHMDQYSFLKLINYIRYERPTAKDVINFTKVMWDDEKYLKPKEYEPWLTHDYDVLTDNKNEFSEVEQLRSVVVALQERIKEQNVRLEQATEDMLKMKSSFKGIIDQEDKVTDKARPQVNDIGYFGSYDRFNIHHEMLSDSVRTSSYRDSLLKNMDYVKGKDVLDVGCGTSILSIFASQAGAKNIVGIDNSEIVYKAMDIIHKNKIENITLLKGRLEDTKLPQDKFDIIISEWMGYFLLYEGMLDSIIYARDNFLNTNGILLPNRCTMKLVGYGNDELYDKYITFWSNVYGLDMTVMCKDVFQEPLIEIVDSEHILTETNIIADLDLMTVDLNYSNFSYEFHMKCTKSGKLSAFVSYFDTYFDLPHSVMFGTGPNDKPTHWKQTVFLLENPKLLKKDEILHGTITCKRNCKNSRSLDITLELDGRKQIYFID